MGLHAEVVEQPITDTLEINYMPYAMSVIISRAIPEIDGFKPSHRKLLYTMYQMKLLSAGRTKSANVVGATMKLNPHGDAAIYETMVRLSRGYGALLHPPVDSKGNFGKVYSRDMAYAASRYTEAKLDGICEELFRDIDKDAVDFVPNYDGTLHRAGPAAHHLPQCAGLRQHGHRRRHGLEPLRVQPGRGLPGHHRPHQGPPGRPAWRP